MRHKAGIICIALGIIMIGGSLLLLLNNYKENTEAGKAANSVLLLLQELISENDALASETDKFSEEMKMVKIKGYEYIGYLSIPVLKLDLPIMAKWDYTRLRIAPCRQFGSTKTDDLVIAGHNYDKHFGRLKQLEYGDSVAFTDVDGKVTTYIVSSVDILQPTEIEKLLNGNWDLALYTCTYGGKTRVTIHCAEVERSYVETVFSN